MDLSALYNLAPDQRAVIDAELQPGETVTWAGQPKPRAFTAQTIQPFLVGIPCTAFSIFVLVITSCAAFNSKSSKLVLIFPIFALVFVCIGVGLLLTPLRTKRDARRIIYLITNQRGIIFQCGSPAKTCSLMLKMMQTFTKNIRADGSGDIVFTGTVPECTGGTYSLMKSGFYSIANVGEVESLLLKLAGKS